MLKSLKAIVPVVVGLVFQVLSFAGVDVPAKFQVAVLSLITSVLVWLVPNVE